MTNEERILQMLSSMNDRLFNIEQEAVKTGERLTHIEQEAVKTGEKLTVLEREIVKTNLKIENEIAKRIDLLTDGFMLTHEKQYELERKLERKIESLEKRVEQLEIKAG